MAATCPHCHLAHEHHDKCGRLAARAASRPTAPKSKRAAVSRAPRLLKSVSQMTAGEINGELDRLDARSSKNTQAFIDAGRGHERPSEYLNQTDALSLEARAIYDRQSDLRAEISRRYGPRDPHRLPRGFGPVRG